MTAAVKYAQVKRFVQDHRTTVTLGTGIVIGAALVTVTGSNSSPILTRLYLTSEQFRRLADDPTIMATFVVGKKETILLLNELARGATAVS